MYPKDKYSVEVFALCYNEGHILQAFIDHYKKNFNASIYFFDNESTDSSIEIITRNNCNYTSFSTDNTIDEDIYLSIKNNLWKGSKADFVIVCDTDEFLEIPTDIEGCTVIKTKGFDMIGEPNSRLGVYNEVYSKYIMFSPKYIQEINYSAGCHLCNPEGKIIENEIHAKLLHRKYISEKHIMNKHKEYSMRNSKKNIENNHALHYNIFEQNDVQELFKSLINKAQII